MSIFEKIWILYTNLFIATWSQVWLPGTYRIQLLQRRKICIFGLIRVTRRSNFSMGLSGVFGWEMIFEIFTNPLGDFEGSWIWWMMNVFFFNSPYIVVCRSITHLHHWQGGWPLPIYRLLTMAQISKWPAGSLHKLKIYVLCSCLW